MTILENQLAIDEGLRLKPYRDTVGKLTIGYGRNLDDVGISKEEALIMMRNDIAVSRRELSQYSWFRNLDDKRKDAVINMHFNLGLPRLLTFRNMIAALERGDYKRAADEALDSRWAVQVGERAVRIARVLRGG